jgi:predicted GNAT family N-acyltransferase
MRRVAKHSFLQGCKAEAMIEQVAAEDCYVLRESILRPNQPKENWTFDTDDDPRSIHLAFRQDQEVVGVVSLLLESHPECPDYPWRLRGMAVRADLQGKGIGQTLMQGLLDRVSGDGIWCTARKHIHGFYLQNGFDIYGDEFTMNDMPHVTMFTPSPTDGA